MGRRFTRGFDRAIHRPSPGGTPSGRLRYPFLVLTHRSKGRAASRRLRRAASRLLSHGSDRSLVGRRATFHDPALQRDFERDGFVVVDLLDDPAVADLQRRYDALDHATQDVYPWVEGFETTLYDPRHSYREQILTDVEAVMSAALHTLLVDHRIMFANYVVKVPHAAEVPLHADWTFLDEDRFSSATVWCPLVDTSVELRNGPLGLVVGSQRCIDFLRIANVASYDRCEEAVEGLPRAVPGLRRGQAVVMDNRVVHFSLPNETAQLRVAAGCVVGPVEADLHHYWMDGEGRLQRFELDRAFYLDYAIGEPSDASGILAVTEVELAPAP